MIRGILGEMTPVTRCRAAGFLWDASEARRAAFSDAGMGERAREESGEIMREQPWAGLGRANGEHPGEIGPGIDVQEFASPQGSIDHRRSANRRSDARWRSSTFARAFAGRKLLSLRFRSMLI